MNALLNEATRERHSPMSPSAQRPNREDYDPRGLALTGILAERRGYFLRYLQQRLGDLDEAEDVLQDFHIRVLAKAAQIKDPASTVAWLRAVLKSVLADHFRRKTAERRAHQLFTADWRAISPQQEEPTEEDDFERTACACFYKLLPTLKPEYTEALSRVDLGQQSRADAARALGITTGNMRVRLHRARHALKSSLERSCRKCQMHDCYGHDTPLVQHADGEHRER